MVAVTRPEFSDAQILAGISAAIRASDLEAAADLVHLLAIQAPHTAQLLIDLIALLADGDDA